MSIKKRYVKKTGKAKCTFKLPKQAAPGAHKVCIAGDFNDWDTSSHEMQKLKSGEFKIELELTPGEEYQFRYLIDEKTWENDWEADAYRTSSLAPVENSVIMV